MSAFQIDDNFQNMSRSLLFPLDSVEENSSDLEFFHMEMSARALICDLIDEEVASHWQRLFLRSA